MGCVFCGYFVSSNVKARITFMAANSVSERVADENSNKMPSRITQEDYINGFEGVTEPSKDYLTISTTYKKESDGLGHLFSSMSSTNSCSHSDSFDIEDLRSFDGLDRRVTNRYDIGLEILKAQIQHGADPKVIHTHGDRSCLMFAVLANDIRFIKQLVEFGVDVNQTNRLGETALGFAIEFERDDIVDYLRSKGAARVPLKVHK
jgi:hypothetical protein